MKAAKFILLIISLIFIDETICAQIIWQESFDIVERGIWGDEDGVSINSNFDDITWSLQYQADSISLTSPKDYAKTVATSGGRFECRDIDGKITWISPEINIFDYQTVKLSFLAKETGSGKNEQTKGIRAFLKIDGTKRLIAEQAGNWGSAIVQEQHIAGKTLQLIVEMRNHYANDKVIIDEIVIEREQLPSPQIDTIEIVAQNQIKLIFSKEIDRSHVEKNNFLLTDTENNNIEIKQIEFLNDSVVLLTFVEPTYQKQLMIYTYNISDKEGNTTQKDVAEFFYIAPANSNDLIFNELMIDPTPTIQLPNIEYIELFNRSEKTIDLYQWKLIVNNNEIVLPTVEIEPQSYLVLVKDTHIDSLLNYKNVLGISNWKTLINSGATLLLKDYHNNLINRFSYDESWMKKIENSGGGYSLERIDVNRNCYQQENWLFSRNEKGGTPGAINSVAKKNIDKMPPTVINVEAISDSLVNVSFSENINHTLLTYKKNYRLDDNRFPDTIIVISESNILLRFSSKLAKNKIYVLSIDNLTDNCDNLILPNENMLQWYSVEKKDVVINEILFNPVYGGSDYVEIYNQSSKYIHLNRLILARLNSSNQIIQSYPISNTNDILNPNSYLVLTKDTNGVYPYFSIQCYDCFWQMSKFPAFPNEKGGVAVLNTKNTIIDKFNYSQKMHHPIYWDEEGISLERFSFKDSSNNAANWHSASSVAGYGTPGYENSQAEEKINRRVKVSFEPESFSPNSDNYNDEYSIHYELDKPDYIANIMIFNPMGYLVSTLASNEVLSVKGTIHWDGTNETGRRLPLGVYIVLVKIFHPDGDTHQFKHGVVLTDVME